MEACGWGGGAIMAFEIPILAVAHRYRIVCEYREPGPELSRRVDGDGIDEGKPSLDSDGDGIPNAIDRDSDNDVQMRSKETSIRR